MSKPEVRLQNVHEITPLRNQHGPETAGAYELNAFELELVAGGLDKVHDSCTSSHKIGQ